MAKRRRLDPPSADRLRKIEEELDPPGARKSGGARPPIASVAGEAAAQAALGDPALRAEQARDSADATRYREALAAGLVVQEIALSDIVADALLRDRIHADNDEMEELKTSIAAHGLRLPIEVFARPSGEAGEPYALISGWRRLMAVRALFAETGDARYAHIPAILRQPDSADDAYIAMVEENEIRADLSQYERGRIAVLAAQQGVFESVEAAVNSLFHAGSKAKRSKIRSFAELHLELGDLLSFPTHLSERQGLRLVGAIRSGHLAALRQALRTGAGVDPSAEWALLEAACADLEAEERRTAPRKASKGGRPPRRSEAGDGYYRLSNGITLIRDSDSRGYLIRIEGKPVNIELMDEVLFQIKRLLEPV